MTIDMWFDESSRFDALQWDRLPPSTREFIELHGFSPVVRFPVLDARDSVLERRHQNPRYEGWVLACLGRRLNILADQSLQHLPGRRAEIVRIMRGTVSAP